MLELYGQIEEAVSVIKSHWDFKPHAGVILGTGLGGFVEEIAVEATIDYGELPHFPRSTAVSHRGRLVCGRLAGLPVMAMEGRFHMYEGYSLKQITLPVRVMRAMGAELLVVSNACGGMNPYFRSGDIMVIEDHINLLGDNPLIGINDDRLGLRFPDMSEPYERKLIDTALDVARRENISAHQGVFVAVPGPNWKHAPEYRFLRLIGADVVGMSTVPEVIVARHCGLRVVGFSIVTDMCLPDALEPADVAKIIAIANAAEPKLRSLVRGVLAAETAAGSMIASRYQSNLAGNSRAAEAAVYLRQRWPRLPRVGIILGTGLGQLAASITRDLSLLYQEIPHFPRATAMGHKGQLVCGALAGISVIALDGRFHFYEGYSAEEITLPIAVMRELGVEMLIVSNASGGLNPQFRSGDVMALADHIDLMGRRTAALSLREALPSRSGGPEPYDAQLIEMAQDFARRGGFACHRGTYVAVLGPNYETRAEYRAMRRLGGDAVGMSTVPEVLAATRCGLRVLALSTITNIARPDALTSTKAEEVVDIATLAEPKLRTIVMGVLERCFTQRSNVELQPTQSETAR